jgi:1-acyl-sn-glycerol-3-phosphate acyltransferase
MKSTYKFFYIILFPFFSIMHRVHCKGRENVPEGAALICANHTSLKDPILVAFAMGFKYYTRFMAKIELMKKPVLGALLKSIGVFGVKRGQADLSAMKTAIATLKGGEKLTMFPEGHRVSEDESSDAKTGAIMLASKTGVPILPVYIPREKKFFGRVDVVIGKPYYLERIKGGSEAYSVYAKELMQKIEELKP